MMNKPTTVLICGGSKRVFEDIAAAKEIASPDAIIAINNILAELPHVDFFVSMHPTRVPLWLKQRRDNGYLDPKSFWTVKDRKQPLGLKFQTVRNTRGGSGLLAVAVARYLGYAKIILAGIPMTPEGAHYHDARIWKECGLYRRIWETNEPLRLDTRSVSGGWTEETLGRPTVDWLNY